MRQLSSQKRSCRASHALHGARKAARAAHAQAAALLGASAPAMRVPRQRRVGTGVPFLRQLTAGGHSTRPVPACSAAPLRTSAPMSSRGARGAPTAARRAAHALCGSAACATARAAAPLSLLAPRRAAPGWVGACGAAAFHAASPAFEARHWREAPPRTCRSASRAAAPPQGNPLSGMSPAATRRKQARRPARKRLRRILRQHARAYALSRVPSSLTPPAPQIQNSLSYRAKQRGFLELDLLVVRALPRFHEASFLPRPDAFPGRAAGRRRTCRR